MDGELGWLVRLRLRLHMVICHRCRGFVDIFGSLGDAIARLSPPPDDEAAVERIAARMALQARAARASAGAAVPHFSAQDRGRPPDPDDDAPANGR
jgi:anti-sigma factor ChrR (cupin superfamily)